MRPAYRLRQFLHAIRPRQEQTNLSTAAEYLSPSQLLLFRGMTPSDQSHCVRVLRSMQEDGVTDRDLLAAALLHDVGKSQQPLRPWERALVVLTERLAPRLATWLGESRPTGWRRPFAVAAQHAEWGADLVQQVGGSTRLVRLIRDHQREPEGAAAREFRRALRKLQAADDNN